MCNSIPNLIVSTWHTFDGSQKKMKNTIKKVLYTWMACRLEYNFPPSLEIFLMTLSFLSTLRAHKFHWTFVLLARCCESSCWLSDEVFSFYYSLSLKWIKKVCAYKVLITLECIVSYDLNVKLGIEWYEHNFYLNPISLFQCNVDGYYIFQFFYK